MRTVYINPGVKRPAHVDFRINSVMALPRIAAHF
jgi:hypothetical protein